MRDMLIMNEPYPECCGVDVLCSFITKYNEGADGRFNVLDKRTIRKDEWYRMLYDTICDTGDDPVELAPMYTFVNATVANKGVFTPAKFAAWLRRQKEEVVESKPAKNKGENGHTLTGYFWVPSSKFKKAYKDFAEKELKKQEKRDDRDDDGYW